jgi:phage gpG-like protein
MSDIDRVIARIEKMRSAADPQSPQVKQALVRIGTVLEAQMKLNIRRNKMIDHGGLLNSIKYYVSQSGNSAFVSVGSYGIKYAAINEFGGEMSHAQVAAMFANIRKTKGNQKQRGRLGGKVVTVFKGKEGGGFWRARPFIRPALKTHSSFIIDTIRRLGKSE